MIRCNCPLVFTTVLGVTLLALGASLALGSSAERGDKQKKQIDIVRPKCNADNQNDASPANSFTANGTTSSPKEPVYGVLFDPDLPDLPIPGITDPLNNGALGNWKITYAPALAAKTGYLLRVIGVISGESNDCPFNITTKDTIAPVKMLAAKDPVIDTTDQVTTTTSKKFVQIHGHLDVLNPQYVHGELVRLDPDGKTVNLYLGKTFLSRGKGTTHVFVEIDVTGATPGMYTLRLNAANPKGHTEKKNFDLK